VTDVHIVNALISKAGCHLLSFLFNFENQGKKTFNTRGRDIVAVRALDQGLSFEVENGYEASHCAVYASR